MNYTLKTIKEGGSIMVVGCGGTGGYVAEGLCRLLLKEPERRLILVDHDRVQKKNIGRQNFYDEDLGRFKAAVLAERLARQFHREVEFTTERIEKLTLGWRGALTIGCVDNHRARRRLEIAGDRGMCHVPFSYCNFDGWYIDAGNGAYTGQVLIGNALLKEMGRPFLPSGLCERLPLPTIQQPALLSPESRPRRRRDCAAALAAGEQSPVINRLMADLVLAFVHKLLKGTLTWMGAYIDLESGHVNFVDATPEAVSRLVGTPVRYLVRKKEKDE